MSSKLSIPNTVRHSVEQMIDGKISKAEPLSGGCSFPTFGFAACLVRFQTLLVKSPTAEFALGQDSVLMDFGCLLVITE